MNLLKVSDPPKRFSRVCRKNIYVTRELAEYYKIKCEKTSPGLVLYTYECQACRGFHLTKQFQRK